MGRKADTPSGGLSPVADGRLVGKAKDAETLAYAGLPRQILGHQSFNEAL